jgi:hypothetical protein
VGVGVDGVGVGVDGVGVGVDGVGVGVTPLAASTIGFAVALWSVTSITSTKFLTRL